MTKIKMVKCFQSQLVDQCYRIQRKHIVSMTANYDARYNEKVYTIFYDNPYLLLEDFDDSYRRIKQPKTMTAMQLVKYGR